MASTLSARTGTAAATTSATPRPAHRTTCFNAICNPSASPRVYPNAGGPSLPAELAPHEKRVQEKPGSEAADMRDPGDRLALAADAGEAGRGIHDEPQHDQH